MLDQLYVNALACISVFEYSLGLQAEAPVGRVAQLVEQRTFNPQVVGSIPTPVIPLREAIRLVTL